MRSLAAAPLAIEKIEILLQNFFHDNSHRYLRLRHATMSPALRYGVRFEIFRRDTFHAADVSIYMRQSYELFGTAGEGDPAGRYAFKELLHSKRQRGDRDGEK